MKMKFCALLAGASLLALAGAANAAQPLSDTQMDGVTAGAAAIATGQALAIGDFLTFTQTVTATDAVTSLTLSNGTRTIGSALGEVPVPGCCRFRAVPGGGRNQFPIGCYAALNRLERRLSLRREARS